MQPGKKGLVGGICIAVGVVIIAVAFGIAFPVLNSMKEAGIRSQLVVPAEGTEEWDAYASSETQADDLPFRQHFYFFNLTNPFEFYAGTENAIFDEVGPYVYRSWTKVFDAERTENTVKKYSYTWFTFEDDLSEGDPMTDRVIAINPTFLGALGEFGGEAGLLGMATSMALTQFVAGLSDPAAITEGYVGATGAALGGYRTATTLGGGLTTDGFIQNWRMTLMNTIPNATAYDLWDDGPTSLTNPNPMTNMFGGLILAQRTGAPTNASEALIMGAHAGIDATGMAALAAWIGPAVVGTVQAGAGVTSDAELVYAQWYNNGFFGMPLTLIDPAVYLFPIGYGAYLDTVGNTTSLNLTQATNVLNMFSNPVNFAGPAAVGDFMFRAATGDVGTIQAIYGIPPGEVPLMVDYLLHIQGTYGLFGLQAMTTLDAGAGLFADKTPHEWLFEYIDPLVMQNVALFENQTSEADVEGDIPDEIWTGDDDLSKAGYIYKVNDSTTYNDYGPTLEVSGSTGASFGPNPDTSSDLELWLGLFKRSVPLTHVGSRTLYDVELQTWEFAPAVFGSPDEFDSADDYNNPGTGWWLIDWFVPSVNLRVSLPYFEGVPEDDRPANLSGIPEPDPDNPKVGFFDIEPETGGAFATNMPLQICFEIGPLLSPTLYPNIPDTCAPFLWLETPLEISEDLANQFKDALGAVGTIRIVILSAGGVIGLIFVVAGVVMFMKSRARSNKVGVRKYGDLDDKDDGEGR